MEIWTIIENDHRKIEELLERLSQQPEPPLLRELKDELSAHMAGEEHAVYPTLRGISGFEALIDNAIAEHGRLSGMVEQIGTSEEAKRRAIAEHLQAAFKAHSEEEEWRIYPLAKKELPYHVTEHMKHEFESAKAAARADPRSDMPDRTRTSRSSTAALGPADSAFGDLLERLIQLEHGVVAAYEAAIDRLAEEPHRSALGEFAEDHLRHLHDFNRLLEAMGRKPPARGGGTGIAEWSGVAVGGLVNDRAVLKAMRSNEEKTLAAYESASSERESSAGGEILRQALEDERRHCAWFSSEP